MYIVKAGYNNNIPLDPEERALYYLEQIQCYLIYTKNKNNSEYKQIELIFESFLNILTGNNFVILADSLIDTSRKITHPYHKCRIYWAEFLKFVEFKLKGP